jgi:RHH-type proline utilization regulon transcriptional repressor/proline dehydrogenase/delta 1-pyrroline-5-carboxylate dehydrogenase
MGVKPGSEFHLTEYFGPVLGVMTAATLDEAIGLQNAVAFGLTGGIHSLDDAEVDRWLDRVEVGNAYVNRHITGAIVQRQPFGGWKASVVGPGAKAGGPNYVPQLGSWSDGDDVPSRDTAPDAWLAWAVTDDETWWRREFGVEHDPTGLTVETNVLRYRPIPELTVRVGAGASGVEVRRVLHAAAVAGVPVTVVPALETAAATEAAGVTGQAADMSRSAAGGPMAMAEGSVVGQKGTWSEPMSDADFAARVRSGAVKGRIRLVGSSGGLHDAAAEHVGEVTIVDAPVVASGRRELMTVLREQAVSRTRHRYGHVK